MPISRKEFLEVAGRGAASLALANSVFGSLAGTAAAKEAKDVLDSPELRKVREHIAASKEAHIAAVQKDLQQPSVSSWNKGVKEMCDVMMESFRKLGCKEVVKVDTSLPNWPGVLAHYDVGAPKTVVVYMMYDTQPWVEERWSSPPLAAARVKNFGKFPEAIVARGAVNSKGPNRFTLNAMESIIAVHGKLPVNVIFTCDGAEEQGSPNFHEVLDPWRDRLKKANACSTSARRKGPDGAVSMALGNKGIMYIELEATRRAAGAAARRRCRSTRRARPCSTARCGGWCRRSTPCSTRTTNEILIAGFKDDIRPPNARRARADERAGDEAQGPPLRRREREHEGVRARLEHRGGGEAPHLRHHAQHRRHLGGYTGEGTATILPEKATAKIDARLVPNQEVDKQIALVRAHLDKQGFQDLEIRKMGGGDQWSQTSVKEAVVQATLATYKHHGIEPQVWPRSAGSSPEWEYTRKLGLPVGRRRRGPRFARPFGRRVHRHRGRDPVGGIVESEQSMADLMYVYANWSEPARKA